MFLVCTDVCPVSLAFLRLHAQLMFTASSTPKSTRARLRLVCVFRRWHYSADGQHSKHIISLCLGELLSHSLCGPLYVRFYIHVHQPRLAVVPLHCCIVKRVHSFLE